MKRLGVLASMVGFFCSITMLSVASAAPANTSNAQLQRQIRKISAQMQSLQREVNHLHAQLAHKNSTARKHRHVAYTATAPQHRHRITRSARVKAHANEAIYHSYLHSVLGHPITVTTSPIFGIKSGYSPADLLEQYSSYNEDLTLLQQRQQILNHFKAKGVPFDRPLLEVSGGVEAQALYSDGFGGATSNINLSTAELDFNAIAGPWANAFVALDYNDTPTLLGGREPKSKIYLSRGFVTIGNLNKFPVYLTIGQLYVPFGRYSTDMVSTPLTESLARTLARAAILGFSKDGIYAQAYGYAGAENTGGAVIFKQFGGNLGFTNKLSDGSFDVGLGVISNIADSEGMVDTGLNNTAGFFNGYGQFTVVNNTPITNFYNIRKRVPAGDVHAEITHGPWSLKGEYINSLTNFNSADMTFNGSGARPGAMQTEIDYLFHLYSKPVTFGIIYGRTWQALALNLPQQSFIAVLSTSIWKDTSESIEFRHDLNYSGRDVATGGSFANMGVPVPGGTGGTRNTITGQIGVYF